MKKNNDGFFCLDGKLESITDGVTTEGQFTCIDYIVVDGEKWGNILILGSVSELQELVGKEVELRFADDKVRFLVGTKEKGEKDFHTANKTLVGQMKSANTMKAFVFPILLAVITAPIYLAIGGVSTFLVWSGLFAATFWAMDLTTLGKAVRNSKRFLDKYDKVN